ncbi:MAG: pyridoxamine 5'-phosphate oxidase family protein [Hyphomicrobiales bacterium]
MADVRRKDYQHTGEAAILALLDGQAHGYLAFVRPDGSPGVVALNFARVGEIIYFHGALEGEKAESIRREPRVTFMVTEAFSLLPSYFTNPTYACPATQYYKAVVVHGEARFVSDPAEKARGLEALMQKLQPEGGYRPIDPADPLYTKSLSTTGVIALPMTTVTAKFKFGQNLPKRKRARVAKQLTERGRERDLETVAAIREVCPFE